MSMRIIDLNEIVARERDILESDVTYRFHLRGSLSRETTGKLQRQVYSPTRAILSGFAPLAWDQPGGWLYARRAMCIRCGHIVATNQPSWMLKHNHSKHGDDRYPRQASFVDVLQEARAGPRPTSMV